MEKPLVSIVTPTLNQARFLEETIHSVIAQDYANIEYILVDGGSQDGSLEIIEKYASHFAWWVSEPDRGQTDAINKGLSKAHGEILAWINSDDVYLPGAIGQAVKALQDNPDAGMIYGDANLIDENGKVIAKFPARQTNYHRLRRGYVHIPQQSSFFKSSLWKQVGPLDPTFYFAMDYDLWVRIARLAPLVYIPVLLANFRLHRQGKTVTADDRCWPEMLRVHYRDGGGIFSWLVVKAKIRRFLYSRLSMKVRLQIRRAI